MKIRPTPACEQCGEEEDEDTDHHMTFCPAYDEQRQAIFKHPKVNTPFWTRSDPILISKYVEKTGRLQLLDT